MNEKVIIFSAPSGSGKTTIVKHLMEQIPELEFSISATSRQPRGKEQNGTDYYFLDSHTFRQKINNGDFLEWEEVYEGTYYGTLKNEVKRISAAGKTAVFDIDVVGATNIKKQYGDNALAVFIKAPTLETLEKRLRSRNTDQEEVIIKRLDKAEKELGYAQFFDKIIINDSLGIALKEAKEIVRQFVDQK